MKLRRLTNPEYDRAIALAKNTEIPLSQCPTCKAKPQEIPNSGGVYQLECGTYRYMGETHPCDCQTQIKLRTHYLAANIGEQYQRLNWDDFVGDTDAVVGVKSYLDKWESFRDNGMGIEFGGPLGVGKTFAMTHIGKELIKRNQRVYFLPFVELVSAFEKENGQDIENRLRSTPFVILDEIIPSISQRQHNFFATRLEAIIRHRTNFNMPTITGTNMTEDELNDEYPRTYSLLSAKQFRVEMGGEDVRRTKIAEQNLELAANEEVRPIT